MEKALNIIQFVALVLLVIGLASEGPCECPTPQVTPAWPTPTQETWETPDHRETRRVTVDVGTLNVRSGPTTTASVVDKVHYGDVLIVLEEVDGWLRVTSPSLLAEGWVLGSMTIDG